MGSTQTAAERYKPQNKNTEKPAVRWGVAVWGEREGDGTHRGRKRGGAIDLKSESEFQGCNFRDDLMPTM